MRPTTRLLAAAVGDAVPGLRAYPPMTRYWPSADRLSCASLEVEPPTVSCLFEPATAVGNAIVCTAVPEGVTSWRKTAVAFEFSAAAPSPTRVTTMFPGVNDAP